jgi:Secretion system C-terminal sorting domain
LSPLRVNVTDTILIATNESDTSIWIASTPLLALPQTTWAQRAATLGAASTWGTDTSLLVPTIRRGFVIRPNINVRTNTQEVKGNIAQLDLAPNPTSHELRVRLQISEMDNLTLQVVDLAGRIVLTEKMTATKYVDRTLNVAHLPQGMYLLHVASEKGGRALSKFVKE